MPARATGDRQLWGTRISKGRTASFIPTSLEDEAGLKRLFTQFSFPGGIPSHVAPETPGSIHEGGELGYSLSHAFGAAFDNPDLLVACVIGDGEAETGPLATGWHSNKFLNAKLDGAVLPILHLNGYKIANPTVLARISREELEQLLRGYGYVPYFVEGDDPARMHQLMGETLDTVVSDIKKIQTEARQRGSKGRPRWPMIVLKTPKGWTGPKVVDGQQVEGTYRSHQVPLSAPAKNPEHLRILESWLRSYKPQELFDKNGRLLSEIADLAPKGNRRMGANPHANGGILLRDLRLPSFADYAVNVPSPGSVFAEDTGTLGKFLRDVIKENDDQKNFRIFGPDETASNRLTAVLDATNKQWDAQIIETDDHLAPAGRLIEVLSEHQCEGWLEGYLLTGRHGLFNCYEAFIHIIDSMFNQHSKWLKVTRKIPWRRSIASLNILLSSHVWRQDHNGFTHQDPGFIDLVCNKKAEVIRVYLPPDANCLLSVMDHCLRSRHYVNVVVAGKHPAPQWLNMDQAIKHCTAGIGLWEWASNDAGGDPDLVMAAAGDVPTLETLAAISILRKALPELKIRMVNIVDLMRLQPSTEHPHGTDRQRVRHALHARQAGHLCLPRISLADSPINVSASEPRQSARARVQGRGDDHNAVRHDRPQRDGPLPSGDGCGRSPASGRWESGLHPASLPRQTDRAQRIHPQARRRHAGNPRLELGEMIIPRRGHWYAVELPVPMLIALVPLMAVLFLEALSALRDLFS